MSKTKRTNYGNYNKAKTVSSKSKARALSSDKGFVLEYYIKDGKLIFGFQDISGKSHYFETDFDFEYHWVHPLGDPSIQVRSIGTSSKTVNKQEMIEFYKDAEKRYVFDSEDLREIETALCGDLVEVNGDFYLIIDVSGDVLTIVDVKESEADKRYKTKIGDSYVFYRMKTLY